MKKEKKQFKELSDEDLKNVNGGGSKTNFTVTVAQIKGYKPGDPAGFFFQNAGTTEASAKG